MLRGHFQLIFTCILVLLLQNSRADVMMGVMTNDFLRISKIISIKVLIVELLKTISHRRHVFVCKNIFSSTFSIIYYFEFRNHRSYPSCLERRNYFIYPSLMLNPGILRNPAEPSLFDFARRIYVVYSPQIEYPSQRILSLQIPEDLL